MPSPPSTSNLSVLVVDDSAVIRTAFRDALAPFADLRVDAVASAEVARPRLLATPPHVVILDIELPGINGLAFLAEIMATHPMPVIVCSAQAGRGSTNAIRALELGAFEVLAKSGPRGAFFDATSLAELIRAAGRARLHAPRGGVRLLPPLSAPPTIPGAVRDRVIVVGASTGGPAAIAELARRLPAGGPPIVVALHISAPFSAPLASRLALHSRLHVDLLTDGATLQPGALYLCPGDHHVRLDKRGGRWRPKLSDEPPIERYRPNIDVLFDSVAASADPHVAGLLLTGMGKDGARGLRELRQKGAYTLVEDPSTATVFGMPQEAVRLGAATHVAPLGELPGLLVRWSFAP